MRYVENIHQNSRKLYGAPRITKAMNNLGHNVHKSTISRWMKEASIFAKTKRKFRVKTTDSNHKLPIAEDKLKRDFNPTLHGAVLSSDITYVPTSEGWLYLAVTIDLFSRRVVGWNMDQNMDVNLVLNALEMAVARSKPQDGVIIILTEYRNMQL